MSNTKPMQAAVKLAEETAMTTGLTPTQRSGLKPLEWREPFGLAQLSDCGVHRGDIAACFHIPLQNGKRTRRVSK